MPPPAPEDTPPRAVRLTFSYGPDGIQLIDQRVIDKRLPPSDALPAALDGTTIAAEVRTAGDARRFLRVVPQAIPVDVEVFSPDGSVRRDPSPPARGVFTVLVPDDPEGLEVVLLARQPDVSQRSAQAGGQPVQLARFPLRGKGQRGSV